MYTIVKPDGTACHIDQLSEAEVREALRSLIRMEIARHTAAEAVMSAIFSDGPGEGMSDHVMAPPNKSFH